MIFYKAKIWELDLLLLSEQESGIIMYIFSLWHDAPVLRYKRKSKNVTFFVPVIFSSLVSRRKPSNNASIWLGFSFPASSGWSQDVSRLALSRLLIEPFNPGKIWIPWAYFFRYALIRRGLGIIFLSSPLPRNWNRACVVFTWITCIHNSKIFWGSEQNKI